jgi:hypothetical protein
VDIRGVVVRERGGGPRVEHLQLGDAGTGEVLMRILASGVCHSDMYYQLGGLGDDFPYLLGHEGARSFICAEATPERWHTAACSAVWARPGPIDKERRP